jgi:hypothetical protein
MSLWLGRLAFCHPLVRPVTRMFRSGVVLIFWLAIRYSLLLEDFFESIFCRLVTEATAASHEVGRASECYEHRGCKAVRVTPHPPWPCCFQLTFAGLHLAAGPRFLAKTGSSSRALSLLYRVLTDSDPPEPSRDRAPSLGFVSPSRRQHRESTCRRAPTLAYVPPSAFLTLSTACSSRCLAGLFHPTATSGIHSSGAFPATKPSRLVTAMSPRVVDDSHLQPSCPGCPVPAVSPSGS